VARTRSCYQSQVTNAADPSEDEPQPWNETEPGQLIAKGHGAGDIIEADQWQILEETKGLLVVEIHLPEHARDVSLSESVVSQLRT